MLSATKLTDHDDDDIEATRITGTVLATAGALTVSPSRIIAGSSSPVKVSGLLGSEDLSLQTSCDPFTKSMTNKAGSKTASMSVGGVEAGAYLVCSKPVSVCGAGLQASFNDNTGKLTVAAKPTVSPTELDPAKGATFTIKGHSAGDIGALSTQEDCADAAKGGLLGVTVTFAEQASVPVAKGLMGKYSPVYMCYASKESGGNKDSDFSSIGAITVKGGKAAPKKTTPELGKDTVSAGITSVPSSWIFTISVLMGWMRLF